MKVGFLVFKILQFYVFKMATNGGRNFEMQLILKFIKLNLFLKSMHKHTRDRSHDRSREQGWDPVKPV